MVVVSGKIVYTTGMFGRVGDLLVKRLGGWLGKAIDV